MINSTQIVNLLLEHGLASQAATALLQLFQATDAVMLDNLHSLPPDTTGDTGSADGQSLQWTICLLQNMLDSGDAPLACLWVAMHFLSLSQEHAVWVHSGAKVSPPSPFVYAMQ